MSNEQMLRWWIVLDLEYSLQRQLLAHGADIIQGGPAQSIVRIPPDRVSTLMRFRPGRVVPKVHALRIAYGEKVLWVIVRRCFRSGMQKAVHMDPVDLPEEVDELEAEWAAQEGN